MGNQPSRPPPGPSLSSSSGLALGVVGAAALLLALLNASRSEPSRARRRSLHEQVSSFRPSSGPDGHVSERRSQLADPSCLLCMSASPDGLILPCGHSDVCFDCLRRHVLTLPAAGTVAGNAICPICRIPVEAISQKSWPGAGNRMRTMNSNEIRAERRRRALQSDMSAAASAPRSMVGHRLPFSGAPASASSGARPVVAASTLPPDGEDDDDEPDAQQYASDDSSEEDLEQDEDEEEESDDSAYEEQQETYRRLPPCPLVLNLSPRDVNDGETCCLPGCNKKPRVQCGHCLSIHARYCSKEHQETAWQRAPYHGSRGCGSFLARVARAVDFSVAGMHIRLRPRRETSHVDPYKQWGFNIFARFQCPLQRQHRWFSARSFVDISLQDMRILRVYLQKCRICDEETTPIIELDTLTERLVGLFQWLRDLREGQAKAPSDGHGHETPPHRSDLCSRCDYGANSHAH